MSADANGKDGNRDGCLCTMFSKHHGHHLLHPIYMVSFVFWDAYIANGLKLSFTGRVVKIALSNVFHWMC